MQLTGNCQSASKYPSMTGSGSAVLRSKSAVALLLTFVAGTVDVIGYLSLHHVFTAHVSGTTAHLGVDLPQHNWQSAALFGSVILAFVVGSVLGRVIIEIGARLHFRRVASITLAIEVLLLAAFILIGGNNIQPGDAMPQAQAAWFLAWLACAMGLQTATLTRVGPLTVHTTFVTGMVNKFAQLFSHALFETYRLHRPACEARAECRDRRRKALVQASFMFVIWCLYLFGAITGTLLDSRIGIPTLYLAVSLLLCAIAVDWARPLSVEEEKDQSER
jgi:uncharacterized membrane protein YoaK (UPF0700 family)